LRDQSGGQPAATADPTPYRVNYFKETNQSEDNWADLIGLTKTLAKGTSNAANYTATYSADYVSAVQAAGDTDQWLRFLAVNTIADNSETNISNGDGDDYFLYFGVTDPRAVLISYDLDTILGRSAGSNSATHNLFRAARGDTGGNPPTPLHPFLIHPKFAREYLAEIKRQIDGTVQRGAICRIADETLGGLVSSTVIDSMKSFNNARLAYIASVMPLSLRE
jgi:spore coat protein CotH